MRLDALVFRVSIASVLAVKLAVSQAPSASSTAAPSTAHEVKSLHITVLSTWTAQRLRAAGLAYLLGAHCTGIEAVFRLRELAGLSRRSAVVAAVGSSFDSLRGLDPLSLAQ